MTLWRQLLLDEGGQTLVEYALLLALVALATVAALTLLGQKIANTFNLISNSLP